MKDIDTAVKRKAQIFHSISSANRWTDRENESISETIPATLRQQYSERLGRVVIHDTVNIQFQNIGHDEKNFIFRKFRKKAKSV